MNPTCKAIIEKFNLISHQEGGFFQLLYEDQFILSKKTLPQKYNGDRTLWNGIYYLLPPQSKSIFHRIRMNELWNFYSGGDLELFEIDQNGTLTKTILGTNINDPLVLPAHVVQNGNWMAAKPICKDSFSFVSCITAPGFTFDDWEEGKRSLLMEKFPQHSDLIIELTNPSK